RRVTGDNLSCALESFVIEVVSVEIPINPFHEHGIDRRLKRVDRLEPTRRRSGETAQEADLLDIDRRERVLQVAEDARGGWIDDERGTERQKMIIRRGMRDQIERLPRPCGPALRIDARPILR